MYMQYCHKYQKSNALALKILFIFSVLASGNSCPLLITYANSLDPDIGSDLDPKSLTDSVPKIIF